VEFSMVMTGVVVLIHCAIFVVEVFLWDKPFGRHAFKLDADFASKTRVMAINQGFYNLFLAGGLVYGLIKNNIGVTLFLLACVAIAGIVGAITSNRKIIFVQTAPAVLAIIMLMI
jgi:putative membrane protein